MHSNATERSVIINKDKQPDQPIPFYTHNAQYALGNGEKEQYFASMRTNQDCIKAIEDTIRDNFDGMHLQCDAKDVIQQFGAERVTYLLANTLQEQEWDGRFSNSNKEWAASFSVPEPIARRASEFLVTSHPAILDGFVKQAREDLKAIRAQPVKKPSIRAKCAEKPVQAERPNGQQTSKDKGAR